MTLGNASPASAASATQRVPVGAGVRAGNRLMAAAEQKTGYGKPLDQVLALEPRFEFQLAPGAAIVEDREYAGLKSCGAHRAATTMISTT